MPSPLQKGKCPGLDLEMEELGNILEGEKFPGLGELHKEPRRTGSSPPASTLNLSTSTIIVRKMISEVEDLGLS